MYEKAIFVSLCPNCEGEINDIRLRAKNPCPSCLPTEISENNFEDLVLRIYADLKAQNKVEKYQTVYDVVSRLRDFDAFFEKIFSSHLWSAQRTWAKRTFLGKSFSIVAPTGIGKTAFGMALALYLAREGERVYFILPTTTLLHQVHKRLTEYAERAGVNAKIIAIHGKMSKKAREEAIDAVRKGDFNILITTTQFLARNFEEIKNAQIDFAFVDDVDAFLKASKNIERILMLLGFDEGIISKAYELIKAKYSLVFRPNDQKLRKKIETLEKEIERYKETHETGQLIVASATGRSRGMRVKLFRELLEFEVGSTRANLRNIINAYDEEKNVKEQILELIKSLGPGGLVFVPLDKGQEFARELEAFLCEKGVKATFATSENATKVLSALESKEIDVAIGMAAYYGTLVRGIDLPQIIKYAIFAGVPKFKFPLTLEGAPAGRIAFLADVLADIVEERREELRRIANRLRRNPSEEETENARKIVAEILQRKEVIEELKKSKEVAVVEENGETRILIADVRTYIQASGRTSRMYAGGITKGLSIVLVDDERVFSQLQRRLRYILEEEFTPLKEINFEEVKRELEEDRRRIGKASFKDSVKTVLFVVESPNKARTIARFFGTPSVYRIGNIKAFEVTTGKYVLNIIATKGHMFDLVTDRGFHGVIIGERFVPVYTTIKVCRKCGTQTVEEKCPVCGTDKYLDDAIWRVNALRLFALESDFVIIGTDPDREGEKIAWDTALAISPYVPTVVRAEFHEVTKNAILRALEETREINERLVEAQIVRRIEDRWIGFELSRKLWIRFQNRTLSAGRVQTPVLGWIIERYKEHKNSVKVFVSVSAGNITTTFETDEKTTKSAEEKARKNVLVVQVRNEREEEVSPPPPFSTDEMLKEAGTRMGLGAREIMNLAQDLFEAGLITYHRTDSIHVSPAGMAIAREYIREKFGEEYYEGRPWGEEGAHECIRPTKPIDTETLIRLLREGELNIQGLTKNHLYLYSIIFERFMASQMKKAKVKRADVVYTLGEWEKEETITTDIIFPGWTAIRPMRTTNVEPGEYTPERIRAFKMATVPLYTQADVVALMKERGIGRPSTYATIIQKLLDRRYVLESKTKRRLYPTPLGIQVYEYLSSKFSDLVSEKRTRELEDTLDAIAEGRKDYQEAIKETYDEIKGIEGGI